MKKKLIMLLVGSCGLMAWSQTNTSANLPAQKIADRDVGLGSDHFVFSGDTRQLVYSSNVWVTNSQGKLTCERLTINLPAENSADPRPTNIVAETNVIIDFVDEGRTNHVTCDKMINVYRVMNSVTNDTFTFTGHARMSDDKMWMTGEPLVWNNVTQQFSSSGGETHIKAPPSSSNGTNTSPFDILKKP